MTRTRVLLWGLVAALLAIFVWLSLQATLSRQQLAGSAFGVPFQLVTQTGEPITEKAFVGKPTALFFGFTHCPEICPTTVYELSGWLDKVDPKGTEIQAYFVTVDPERDTPEFLGTYLSNVTKRIIGISGDPAKVEAMAKGFKVYFKKVPTDPAKPDGDYTMDHTASVFLLDREGKFVGTIAYEENSETAEQKLKNLITRAS